MGFWIAVAAGWLMLLDLASSPVASLLDASFFFAVAWGIRRGQWWAAVAGAYLLLMPVLRIATLQQRSTLQVAVVGTVALMVASLMLRTAAQLRAVSPGGRSWPWLAGIGLTLLAVLFLRPMVLPTGSMADTLQPGDRFLIEIVSFRLGPAPAHGDLVVFHYPPDRRQVFVKRVVGLPGDRIGIEGQTLYRNGRAVAEPYVKHTAGYFERSAEVVVPGGCYFVLGDNRDHSLDSRHWGFLAREDIIGRPLVRYASQAPGGAWPKLLTRS
jgi:signal peptidase I